MAYPAVILACYLLGAIPFGVMVGRLTRGIDIRQFGSGNIGATNVYRTLGRGPAVLVLVLDTVKGFAAIELCKAVGMNEYWIVAGGLVSVAGHTFSAFLHFRGGKGVATSLGVIIGLNPVIGGISFGIWLLLVATIRYISIASILATISVPTMMILWKSMSVPLAYQVLAVVATLGIVAKHTSNIKRLLNGTEPRFGQRVATDQPEDGKGATDEA